MTSIHTYTDEHAHHDDNDVDDNDGGDDDSANDVLPYGKRNQRQVYTHLANNVPHCFVVSLQIFFSVCLFVEIFGAKLVIRISVAYDGANTMT